MNPKYIATLLALALTGAACTGAEKKGDEPAPSPQNQSSIDESAAYPELPEVEVPFETFKLENGLTVVVHEDRKVPVVGVHIWYHVGSKDERIGKTGFAHLFEHLMFQGSENFQGEFFEPLEDAGATDMNGTTNRDRTNYFETVPTNALDVALWMESDRMGHFQGAISQERLDEQRGVVQNEKRQGQNRPYGKAWEVIPPNTYPEGHPYSWSVIGSMDDLEAASLDDVKEWFSEYYGASNAVVVLAGDIDVPTAKKKMQKFFGHIPAGPAVPKRGAWVAELDDTRSMIMYDRVPQERAYWVWNVPPYGEEVTEHLRLAARLLGTGKNSRLYKRLVYDEQLATNVYVWFSDGEIGSQFYVVADARPGVPIAEVEDAIYDEVQRFVAEGPRPDELGRIKMNYFTDLVMGLEKVGGFGGKATLLAKNQVFLGDAGAYRELLEVARTASPESVRAAAERWLHDGKFVLWVLPDPDYKPANAESLADRSGVPKIEGAPSLNLPDLQRAKLSNGIEVVLAERHDVPVVRLRLVADGGYASDSADTLGLAQLAMDVLDEGTTTMSSLELAAELEKLGASLSSSTNLDTSSVYLTTLSTTLEPSLDIWADVVKAPAFAKEELERRRKQQLTSIEQEKTQPFSTALRLLGPLLYGDEHPYGVPLTGSGTTATVESLSREQLVAFHAERMRPENLRILIVGDTTMGAIQPLLEDRFGSLSAEGDAPKPASATVPKRDGVRVFLVDKPNAEQSLIVAGNVFAERGKVDAIDVDLMNTIIGGSFTSRINMNLREDKHWSYGARSFIYETQGKQAFGTYANVQSDKTSESIAEMKREIDEYLTTRPPTAEELGRIKQNKVRKLPGANETTDRLLSSVSEIVLFGLPDDYYDTYADKVMAATPEQVLAAAKKAIKPGEMTWIIVGDLAKVRAGIEALELGKVTVIDAAGKPVAK
jgi:zinc protease